MSEAFYEKLIGLFFRFFLLLFLMLIAVEFTVLSLSFGFLGSYFLWSFIVVALTVYLLRCYFQVREFKENLSLFLPQKQEDERKIEKLEPLNMELSEDDVALKVCLLYRNGVCIHKIRQIMGWSHPNKVRRMLIRGLDILLKNYEESGKKNAKHTEE